MMKNTAFWILAITLFLVGGAHAESSKQLKKRLCISPGAAESYLQRNSAHLRRSLSANDSPTSISVSGNIVVVEASSELVIIPNEFDLKEKTIRFDPSVQGRYTYSVVSGNFNANASTTLTLGDDDSYELSFGGFRFPFGGKTHDRAFINSNGSITFERGDTEPPDAEALLSGPPRIAVLFADLDPEASGTVYLNQSADSLTVTWLKVPEFFNQNQFGYGENTFQVVLYSSGRIELNYSREITATQAVLGLIAGNGNQRVRNVDFTKGTSHARPSFSFIEDFRNHESLDIAALLHTFYRSQKDEYDFVTLVSNFELTPIPGVQAFAINVQNSVKGIGDPSGRGRATFNDTSRYGSAQRLQNITFLGNIREYPSDPNHDLSDTFTSTLEILAHEVGHRWLAYPKLTRDGAASGLLLGRDKSHWSFFLDSDGSFLEGNQLQQSGSSSFSTATPFTKYSGLDLYLMGLIPPEDVKDSFIVQGARDFSPRFSFLPESSPQPNIRFKGSALTVRIEDIIAANGARNPDAASSQKKFQHVFVLIVKKDDPASVEDLNYLESVRVQWERYFSEKTDRLAELISGVK